MQTPAYDNPGVGNSPEMKIITGDFEQVKLNDVDNTSNFIWAGDDLLACTTGAYSIRFLEIESTDTYLLYGTLGDEEEFQKFTTISFLNSKGKYIAIATT